MVVSEKSAQRNLRSAFCKNDQRNDKPGFVNEENGNHTLIFPILTGGEGEGKSVRHYLGRKKKTNSRKNPRAAPKVRSYRRDDKKYFVSEKLNRLKERSLELKGLRCRC